MMVFVYEENRITPFIIYCTLPKILILNVYCQFIFNESLYLRVTYPLHYLIKNEITHDKSLLLENRITKNKAILFFSKYSNHYYDFQRYSISKQTFSIGGNKINDIRLLDCKIEDIACTIDWNTKTITYNSLDTLAFINHKYFQPTTFRCFDVLTLVNLQIIFLNDSILVNTCENIQVDLDTYVQRKEYQAPILKPIHRTFRYLQLHFHSEIQLQEPIAYQTMDRNPLLLSIGPSIMISMAAITSSLIMGYRGYLSGRELFDLLPMFLLPGMMFISTITWMPLQRYYEKHYNKKKKRKRENSYRLYLNRLKEDILLQQLQTKKELENTLLSPESILNGENPSLIYQKTQLHNDWLYLRLGVGNVPFHISLQYQFTISEQDRIKQLIEQFLDETDSIDQCIFPLHLKEGDCIALLEKKNALLHRLLIQLTYYYANDQLLILCLCEQAYLKENPWLYVLPQGYYKEENLRLLATIPADMQRMNQLLDHCKIPIICLVQNHQLYSFLNFKPYITFYLCDANQIPNDVDYVIDEMNEQSKLIQKNQCIYYQRDTLMNSINYFDYYAKLNQYQLIQNNYSQSNAFISFYDLYHVDTLYGLEIEKNWKTNKYRNHLYALLGMDEYGNCIRLDLNEQKNGPHGLIAGMTGSGKSILLLNLLLSLSVNYSPLEFQFVLIDFKGGGLANNFLTNNELFPHLAGVLTNLDAGSMLRAIVSFRLECEKREKLFQELSELCGQYIMSLSDYQTYWLEEYNLEYLPALLIVVDEFAELKRDYPDFLQDLIRIARVGRSLGIHLILSTQKPVGVVDDQIWSNMSFKICMKVQEKQDSMEVLHCEDAMHLHEAGLFLLLSNGVIHKAKSGYTYASLNNQNTIVQIKDYQNTILAETHSKSDGQTQFQAVKKEIIAFANRNGYQPYKIWQNELCATSINEANTKEEIGLIDDYQKKQIESFTLTTYQYLNIHFVKQQKILQQYLLLLCQVLLVNANDNDEIYLIDSYHLLNNYEKHLENSINFINKPYQFYLLNKRIKERNYQTKSNISLLITDFTAFREFDYLDTFLSTLEKIEIYNIKIYLFLPSSQAIPYRYLRMFPIRIVLDQYSTQELSDMLDSIVQSYEYKESFGILKRQYQCIFMYYQITSDMFLERTSTKPNLYQLPKMPEIIRLSDYDGEKIVLGRDSNTLEWIELEEYERCILVCKNEIQISEFSKIYPDLKPFVNKEKTPGIYYLLYTKWIQDYHTIHENDAYVFFERPYFEYYLNKQTRNCKEGEAILYYQGKERFIHYVQSI